MKRIVLLLFAIATVMLVRAQVVIKMEKDGGVYKIPCKVNGVKMKFIFDTGASSVCLSMQMAEFLYENGYLSNEDFVGYATSSVADGRIVNNMRIVIKDIEIAGLHISNVEAVVMQSQSAPLLLGQSAIQKLGKISIDANVLSIWTDKVSTDLGPLRTKAESYQEKGLYHLSAPAWEEYYSAYWMIHEERDNDYAIIGDNYYLGNDYQNAIKWYEKIGDNSDINYNILYFRLGMSYLELGNNSIANRYASLAEKISVSVNSDNWHAWTDIYYLKCCVDVKEKDYENALGNIRSAIYIYAWGKYNKYFKEDDYYFYNILKSLCAIGEKDDEFADLVFRLATICYLIGETNTYYCNYIKYAVELGCSAAIEIYNTTKFLCSDK